MASTPEQDIDRRQGDGARLPTAGWAIGLFAVALPLAAVMAGVSLALSVGVGLMLTEIFLIGGPPVLLARLKNWDLTETFSLRRPWAQDLALALVVGAAGWVLASQGSYWLGDLFGADGRTIPMMRPVDPVLIVALTVFAPLEEVLFRGFVLSGLRTRYRPVHAMLLTAVLFGLFHQDATVIPGAMVLGALYGAIVLRTGSLFPAMLAHGVNNLCAGLLSHTEWGISARSPLEIVFAVALIAAGLLAMGRGGERFSLQPPARPVVPLGAYALAGVVCLGTAAAIPFQLQATVWAEAFGHGGTLQHDRYAMRDDFSFRKESTVILLGDPVGLWAEQEHQIRIAPGERLLQVRCDGLQLPFTVAADGATAAIELREPPGEASRLVVVTEGSRPPEGPHRFPAHFLLPGTALKLTVDLRDAPALRFFDTRFRVKSPMFLTLFDVQTWNEDNGYCVVPMLPR